MLQRFVNLSILYLVCVLLMGGLSVIVGTNNSARHIASSDAIGESFFNDTTKTETNLTTNDTGIIQHRYSKKFDPLTSRIKAVTIMMILQRNKTQKFGGKKFNNIFVKNLKIPTVNKRDQVIHREEIRKFKRSSSSGIHDKITRKDVNKKQRKLIDLMKEQRAKNRRRKKVRILQDSTVEKKFPGHQAEYVALDVTCTKLTLNGTSSLLRNLFRLPKLKKTSDCSSRKGEVVGIQENTGSGQSSAALPRFSDRGHAELVNQYEKEQSLDELAGEYIHPEGHISSTINNYRKTNAMHSKFDSYESKFRSGSIGYDSKYSFNNEFPADSYFNENYENGSLSALEINDTVDAVDNKVTDMKMHHNDAAVKLNYYLSLKHKRDVEAILDDEMEFLRAQINENINRERKGKFLFKRFSVEAFDDRSNDTAQSTEKQMQNSTSHILLSLHNFDDIHTTDTPWPIVPGPISCDLDFQLQPSFVAKLGEFDYVVSVQLQRNPDEPADHACTGVVYNPRFIVIAPHCLHDNYGLTVTSTDDLCTIDEMIEVDYIIEHENYDAETRINDIALIKLKSEIHKRSAKLPKEDGVLDKSFYAVGFGELMWRSFPDRISKLLQKVPVRRYSRVPKEEPGTLHITTSHMDLTGAFRGDFGGALINPRGEFVGLKSKLVKKSTEYEVYTRIQTYVPWIQSMVALHGSW